MYTKEELEGMKFRKLRSIAKQKKISRRLTTKREIIDSLLNFEQEECLDDITVDLINNSELEDNPAAMETENGESGKKSVPSKIGKTRSGRRFAKPRMTVFQMYDDDDDDESLAQASKGRRFAKPRMTVFQMNVDDDDGSHIHSPQDYTRKQNISLDTSTASTRSTQKTNYTRKQNISLDTSTASSMGTRSTRKINSGKERDEDEISESKINLANNRSKKQRRYFEHSPDAQDNESHFNETFEINEQQNDPMIVEDVLKSGSKNKTELRRSVRRKTITSSTKCSKKILTSEDENPQLNETFEIEDECDHKSEEKGETSSRQIKKSLWIQDSVPPSLDCNKISLPKDENPQLNNTFEIEEECDHKSEEEGETSSRQINKFLEMQDSVPSSLDYNKISLPKGTPIKTSRIPKFVKKIPDFQSIHKKQFEKMESLVDNQQRKLERAKGLLSPAFRKNAVMVFTAQSRVNQSPLRKPLTQHHGLGIATNGRHGAQNVLKNHNASSLSKNGRNNIHNKQNVKELITKKLPVYDRRENVRQESRTTLRGVRLNRRFELQMAHRKIN